MPAEGTVLVATPRFAFYGDPWIAQHFFLYAWARATGGAAARGPIVPVPEVETLASLTEEERESWQQAVTAYQRYLAHRDPLFDATQEAVRSRLLGTAEGLPARVATEEVEAVLTALRQAAPVYRRHWWPAHAAGNRAWVIELIPNLLRHEDSLAQRLVHAYGGSWPRGTIRVDVAPYSHPLGAFTTEGPHVTIASADASYHYPRSLEMLFHEASHTDELIGQLQVALDAAFAERGGEPPRNLWHVLLFETAGELTRQTLTTAGAAEYVPYARQPGGLYDLVAPWAAMRDAVEGPWLAFLRGEGERTSALARIAAALAPAPEPAAAENGG